MPKFKLGLGLAVLTLWLALVASAVAGVLNLENLPTAQKEAGVDLGEGVSIRIFEGKWPNQESLLVFDRGQKTKELPDAGKFFEAARLESGPGRYWVISAYSGGAHCCGVYYCFSRPGSGLPLRYLGETPGHNGTPLNLKGAIISHAGQFYLAGLDNRFDYFHASHAGSLLVNTPRVFFCLTPDSLQMDNLPFKEFYLQAASGVDQEIVKESTNRRDRPEAIMASGVGSVYEGLNFSDRLGQFLVKRTILYLYAREDARAWQSLEAGVQPVLSHGSLAAGAAPGDPGEDEGEPLLRGR